MKEHYDSQSPKCTTVTGGHPLTSVNYKGSSPSASTTEHSSSQVLQNPGMTLGTFPVTAQLILHNAKCFGLRLIKAVPLRACKPSPASLSKRTSCTLLTTRSHVNEPMHFLANPPQSSPHQANNSGKPNRSILVHRQDALRLGISMSLLPRRVFST
jgi:hypothetical protein